LLVDYDQNLIGGLRVKSAGDQCQCQEADDQIPL
jgi:hypothetical protein